MRPKTPEAVISHKEGRKRKQKTKIKEDEIEIAAHSEEEDNIDEAGEQDEHENGQKEKDAVATPTEFPYDSEDEEWDNPNRNTVGNIPMHFYDEYDHIGYNIHGQKIAKPDGTKDELDKYIAMEDDPNFWRTVHDNINGKDIVLSDEDWSLVKNILRQKFPDNYDPYEEFYETPYADADFPVTNKPLSKAAFTPSIWEDKKVRRLIRSLKNGWITLKDPKQLMREKAEKAQRAFYMIWDGEGQTEESLKRPPYLAPPKPKLPEHAESYNPPAEYLFTDEERKQWEEMPPHLRATDFVPQKFGRLRQVPYYPEYVKEQFERCLDLYLSVRAQKKEPKNKVENSDQLLEKLPKPEELRPYPTRQSIVYLGHTGKVRTISVDPTGQWLASGSEDNTVRIWEVETGRCVKVWTFDATIYAVAWNPQQHKPLLAVAVHKTVHFLNTETGSTEQTEEMLEMLRHPAAPQDPDKKEIVTWQIVQPEDEDASLSVTIEHPSAVKQINWHHKGDYLVVVSPDSQSPTTMLMVHQISVKKSQNPFTKQKGRIQVAKFHPSKPLLFIADQNHVRLYDLANLKLEKKLLPPNYKWISSIDIHPAGDNILVGSYDTKLAWFDLDLSVRPYKNLRFHREAIRQVCYHKRFPLFASCSDDLKLHIFHGMVYNDLTKNALIVPVKQLKGHKLTDELGILDCAWHPIQPWIFSAGADGSIRLYT